MANHDCKIIYAKEVNDENVAYLARCCDDPKTDSWCTVSVHLKDQDHDATLAAHRERVADTHDRKIKALAKAQTVVMATGL